MPKKFQKTTPHFTLSAFLAKAYKVSRFNSSTGREYKVTRIENDIMFFLRLNAQLTKEWNMDLKKIYEAYEQLEHFETVNFKPFVPITHSPARGLLLHLGMLA